jgi:salicylate hydroxylase
VEWGLEEQLEKATQKCRGSTFHSCGYTILLPFVLEILILVEVETGEPIGYLEWKEVVIQETGADFLLMHVSYQTVKQSGYS